MIGHATPERARAVPRDSQDDRQAGERPWPRADGHGMLTPLAELERPLMNDGRRWPRGLQNRLRALETQATLARVLMCGGGPEYCR